MSLPCNTFKTKHTCRAPCQWDGSSCHGASMSNDAMFNYVKSVPISQKRCAAYIRAVFHGRGITVKKALTIAENIWDRQITPKKTIENAFEYIESNHPDTIQGYQGPDGLTEQEYNTLVDIPIVKILMNIVMVFVQKRKREREEAERRAREEREAQRKQAEERRRLIAIQRKKHEENRRHAEQRAKDEERRRKAMEEQRAKNEKRMQEQRKKKGKRKTPQSGGNFVKRRNSGRATGHDFFKPITLDDSDDSDAAGPALPPRPRTPIYVSSDDEEDEIAGDNPFAKNRQKRRKRAPTSPPRVNKGKKQPPVYRPFQAISDIVFDVNSAPCLRPPSVKPGSLPVVPRPHQSRLTKHLINHRGFIAAHSVGTGKTLLAVFCAECVLRHVPEVKGVVVLAPKSLIYNFRQTVLRYGGDIKKYHIMTYDSFYRNYDMTTRMAYGNISMNDKMLIVDEAHNLRTPVVFRKDGTIKSGKRARAILHAASLVQRVLLLTATPIYNRVEDICNLVAMVRGEQKAITPGELEALRKHPVMLRNYCGNIFSFEKQDRTGNDYPRVTRTHKQMPMTWEEEKEYNAAEEEGFMDIDDPFIFLSGVRMASNSLEISKKARFITRKILEGQGRQRKSVVFSNFLEAGLGVIMKIFNHYGITSIAITGEISGKERSQRMNDFNAGIYDVMLISKAGGEGLDMKGVRNMFLYEPAWNDATKDQAEGRAIRYKSHSHLPENEQHVQVYTLETIRDPRFDRERGHELPTADSMLQKIAENKTEDINLFTADLHAIQIPK